MAEKTVRESKVPARTREDKPASTREPMRYLTPAVDIYETEDGLTVVADMPGVKRDDINVQVENNVLTIQGITAIPRRKNPRLEEYRLYNFFRQFELTDEVDHEGITAELKHGVLTLHLPKAEHAKPKRIDVKVS